MTRMGSCHCGQITFEVEGTLEQVFEWSIGLLEVDDAVPG